MLIHSTDIYEILTEGEERYFRLPKQLRCASHTFNLLATNDVNKLEVKDGPYKTLSRRAFGKCRALFNKQNMSTVMADKIKNHLGRYLITPNDTRYLKNLKINYHYMLDTSTTNIFILNMLISKLFYC